MDAPAQLNNGGHDDTLATPVGDDRRVRCMLDTVIMAIADQWGSLEVCTGRGAPRQGASMLPPNRIRIAMP